MNSAPLIAVASGLGGAVALLHTTEQPARRGFRPIVRVTLDAAGDSRAIRRSDRRPALPSDNRQQLFVRQMPTDGDDIIDMQAGTAAGACA